MRRFGNRAVRSFAAVAIAIASLAAGSTSGRADANAAVCAQTYGKSDGLSCNFATYEQCRASVSGISGSCIDNPYYRGAQNQAPRQRSRR